MELICCDDSGDEQSTILYLPGSSLAPERARGAVGALAKQFRTFVAAGELPSLESVPECVAELSGKVEALRLKRLTLVGVGAGGAISQALAVRAAKVLRRLILIDPTVRLSPGFGTRMIDRIEALLPLGLPLRNASNAFDARAFLHRIHCPVLVLVSAGAGEFVREQSRVIAKRVPNAWLRQLEGEALVGDVLTAEAEQCVESFFEVPTKRPQKNLEP
jgi:pimeloyl-ACP methyl ester carboxylesterase